MPTCLRLLAAFLLLTGGIYPLLVTALARLLFPWEAAGSLIERNGRAVGSLNVAQRFTSPRYFHPRPVASASNDGADRIQGPESGAVQPRLSWEATTQAHSEESVLQRADGVRESERLPLGSPVPVDAVTPSGSGLDPHISRAWAQLQVARIAQARALDKESVHWVITAATEAETWPSGAPARVHVLRANLMLDGLVGRRCGDAPEPARRAARGLR